LGVTGERDTADDTARTVRGERRLVLRRGDVRRPRRHPGGAAAYPHRAAAGSPPQLGGRVGVVEPVPMVDRPAGLTELGAGPRAALTEREPLLKVRDVEGGRAVTGPERCADDSEKPGVLGA